MKRLMLTAALLLLSVPAHASGWLDYYDCGDGVVPIFGGWHGKTWLTVEANHELILDEGIFQIVGTAVNEEDRQPLNEDKTDFSFPVEWHGRKVILRYRGVDNEVTFDGRVCRSMGDSRYEGEAQRYEEEKKWRRRCSYSLRQRTPGTIDQNRSTACRKPCSATGA